MAKTNDRSERARREARDDDGRFARSSLGGFQLPEIDARTRTIGAAVVAGVGVGAALFAGWRSLRGSAADIAGSSGRGFATASGDTAPSSADDGLHAMGTPATMPVDGGVRRYTGDGAPDMAVDYVPGEDPTSLDNEDTRRA